MDNHRIPPIRPSHDARPVQRGDAEQAEPQAPMRPPRIQPNEQLGMNRPPVRREPNVPNAPIELLVPPPAGGGALGALPDAVVGEAATFLSARDMGFFSQADASLRGILNPQRTALRERFAEAEAGAANVQDLAGFLRFLGRADAAAQPERPTVADLPEDLRVRPLTVLLTRISALPVEEWSTAAVAFRETVRTLRSDHQTEALRTFERIAEYEECESAVTAGENVLHAMAFFGVTSLPNRLAMESIAVHRDALNLIRAGERIPEIAQRLGVPSDWSREVMDRMAAGYGPAGQEMMDGGNVAVVAARYGIETNGGIQGLEDAAIRGPAGDAARLGENVQVIKQAHGITTDRGIAALDAIVCTQHGALRMVQEGANVRAVIDQFGITSRDSIRSLERSAVERLRLGSPRDYEQHGIDPTDFALALFLVDAYNPAIHAWIHEDPEAVARDIGIESLVNIEAVIALAARLRASISP